MNYDVVTIGDAVQDIFIKPQEVSLLCPLKKNQKLCPEPVLCLPFGDKINIEDVHFEIGGSACNVAVGLNRMKLKVSLIAATGSDLSGKHILERLEKEKVTQKFIKKFKEIKTGFSVIINFKAERTILVYHGIDDYGKLKIPKNLSTEWFYLGPLGFGYEKIYKEAIAQVAEKNRKLALNPGNLQIEDKKNYLKAILSVTKILFVNKKEGEKISNLKGPRPEKEILKTLKKYGPEIVVLTDGANGAFCFDGKEYLKIGTYMAKKLEATGAGDAFSSGFLAGYIFKNDLKEALKYGVINSASVVEKLGAEPGLLTKRQIEEKLKKAPYPRKF